MEKLKLACAKFFAFSNIAVYCYTMEGTLLFKFPEHYSDLKDDFLKNCIEKKNKSDLQKEKPLILTMDEKFHFSLFEISKNTILILGPVAQNPEGIAFLQIYKNYSKYHTCTKMNFETFLNAVSIIYQLCTSRTVDLSDFTSTESLDVTIMDYQKKEDLKPSISYPGELLEQKLLLAVTKGDVDGLKAQFEHPTNITLDMMSSNPVQHQKYLFIIFMTMTVRAAIKGGLDDKMAFDIVGDYCLKMDRCSDIKTISSLIYNMAIHLCKEVNKRNMRPTLSFEIQKCCTYIASHLYSPLDLSTLACAANVSTRSLSNRFKQELKLSPMAYVQKSRIDEAQLLLEYSNYSILDISKALHFSSQSHFTEVFRHFLGQTPNQYRQNKQL